MIKESGKTVRTLKDFLEPLPFIAILRGIRPGEVLDISEALVALGVRAIEIPLNSPEPLKSIELLRERFGEDILVGCGTVIDENDLRDARIAGAQVVLHPHAEPTLVKVAKSLGMISVPGVATPTEAFAMLDAGADALKFFPSEVITPAAAGALLAVLPGNTSTISVGGICAQNIGEYWNAGVIGFGLGSTIYRPGWTADQVSSAFEELVHASTTLSRPNGLELS